MSNRAQLDKLAKSESQRQSIAEEHWYFVTFGAFIYVKAFKDDLTDCEVIGINALSPDDFDEKRCPAIARVRPCSRAPQSSTRSRLVVCACCSR